MENLEISGIFKTVKFRPGKSTETNKVLRQRQYMFQVIVCSKTFNWIEIALYEYNINYNFLTLWYC